MVTSPADLEVSKAVDRKTQRGVQWRSGVLVVVYRLITVALFLLLAASGQVALTTTQIAKRASPSVVSIEGPTPSGGLQGSGFIISKDGKIVTNLHVIRELKSAKVRLASGEIFDSISVLATDERRDLCVIQIAGFDLPVLDLGNSNSVAVGEPVVIVGSPLGLEGTVTAGVLSSIRDSGDGFKVLQTDAAINPGNSGGPLLNSKGQVIGVVSFKVRSSEGLNFALPVNYVKGLLNQLHEPVSLEQMRSALSVTATAPESPITGPSLKETLDWLKEKTSLAVTHWVYTTIFVAQLGRTEATHRTVPVRFDSCTIVFDAEDIQVFERFREQPEVTTTRYTVPLAEISDVYILKSQIPLPERGTGIDLWAVTLSAKSKVILSETHENQRNTSKSESGTAAFLWFFDETIANRVLEAFKHAVERCHAKEPF